MTQVTPLGKKKVSVLNLLLRIPWVLDSCGPPEDTLQIHQASLCVEMHEEFACFLALLQRALFLLSLRQSVCEAGFPKSTWYWLSPASRSQGKYLLRHWEAPPGVAQFCGDFHMCFDLAVCCLLKQRFLWRADSWDSWRLLTCVLQQQQHLSVCLAFMMTIPIQCNFGTFSGVCWKVTEGVPGAVSVVLCV